MKVIELLFNGGGWCPFWFIKRDNIVRKWFVISVILLTSLLLVSCEQAPEFPKMTAPEVCQYVNQALPNEYIPYTPVIRYEYRYTALSAQYVEIPKGVEISDSEISRSIGKLSPEALGDYKQELRQKLKDMNPHDRETSLSILRSIPELSDVLSEFDDEYLNDSEVIWLVQVKVIAEPQRLTEGKWVATPLFETKTYVEKYCFSEATGAIAKR